MARTIHYMTTAEVAAELRVNPETVRRWVQAGKLPAVDIGGGYRIDREDFDQLLADLRVSTPLTTGGA